MFFVPDEANRHLKHSMPGLLSTCNEGPNLNTSNFFVTLGGDLSRHDGKHTIFGEISENFELITQMSREPVDQTNRPYRNIRIKETRVLFDPFDDPPGFGGLICHFSPYRLVTEDDRIEDGRTLGGEQDHEEWLARLKARQNAEVLELLDDLPSPDAKPSENILFVCKLSSVTSEDGLTVFFSRFGKVRCVDLMRDKETGKSLGYGFVTFDTSKQTENAFMKSQGMILDGRPLIVDFSQSVRSKQ
jgi:peptidyl-prolyl cis-trans isomerase-like 4